MAKHHLRVALGVFGCLSITFGALSPLKALKKCLQRRNRDMKMKHVQIPSEITTDIAYETGAHIGDGSMGIYKRGRKIDYEVSYYGHAIHDWPFFLDVLSPLLGNLYRIQTMPRKVSNENTCVIRFRSKKILMYKCNLIGLPLGNKSKLKGLPRSITELSDKHILACIRGIFDTDFSLSLSSKHKSYPYYPRINANLANKNLANDLRYWIKEVTGINTVGYEFKRMDKRTCKVYTTYSIEVNGVAAVKKWLSKIGSNNPKHKHTILNVLGSVVPK